MMYKKIIIYLSISRSNLIFAAICTYAIAVNDLKSDIVVTREHLNLSTLFMVSHVLSSKVSAE